MNQAILASSLALLFVSGHELNTSYSTEIAVRVDVESTFALETTEFSMERDGEPMEGRGGGGGGSSETRHIVMIDTVVETKDGQPTQVLREFERLSSDSVRMRRDEEIESERECPLNEVTLELTLADGEVVAEVSDGDEPDNDEVLAGHRLGLALDALLPGKEVDEGDEWSIDGEMIQQALLIDLESALFPQPEREEGGERGEGGRRGGQGRGRGGQSASGFFTEGVWDVEATLVAGLEEYEGVECMVISIEGECIGVMPEREFGSGGGRRGGGRALSAPTTPAVENSFEMELEGKLYFDPAAKRPVHFEVEGKLSTESTREIDRGDFTMSIYSAQEGTFTYTVDLSEVAAEEDSE